MSKNVKMSNSMKVITGPDTRWSYANVWEPKSINGGTPKYSVSLIIPKSDTKTIAKVKAVIEAAYHEGESKRKGNGKSVPALSVIKTPLRDGDLERPDDAAYVKAYFINANATSAPGIVDADLNPILTQSTTLAVVTLPPSPLYENMRYVMENIVNIANNIVLYTAAYTFLFVIYGVTFYALIKGIVNILTVAYRQLKADWKAWHPDKKDDQ